MGMNYFLKFNCTRTYLVLYMLQSVLPMVPGVFLMLENYGSTSFGDLIIVSLEQAKGSNKCLQKNDQWSNRSWDEHERDKNNKSPVPVFTEYNLLLLKQKHGLLRRKSKKIGLWMSTRPLRIAMIYSFEHQKA